MKTDLRAAIFLVMAFCCLSLLCPSANATWSTTRWEVKCQFDENVGYAEYENSIELLREKLRADPNHSESFVLDVMNAVKAGDFFHGYLPYDSDEENLAFIKQPYFLDAVTPDHARYGDYRAVYAKRFGISEEELDKLVQQGKTCAWLSRVKNLFGALEPPVIIAPPDIVAHYKSELEAVSVYLSETGTRETSVDVRETVVDVDGEPEAFSFREFELVPYFDSLGEFWPCWVWNDASCTPTLKLRLMRSREDRIKTIPHELFHSVTNNSLVGRLRRDMSFSPKEHFIEEGMAEAFGTFWYYGRQRAGGWGTHFSYPAFYEYFDGGHPKGTLPDLNDMHLNRAGAFERTDLLAYENALYFLALANKTNQVSPERLVEIMDHPWFESISSIADRPFWNEKILHDYLRTNFDLGPLDAQANALEFLTKTDGTQSMFDLRDNVAAHVRLEEVMVELGNKGRVQYDRNYDELSHMRTRGTLFLLPAHSKPMRVLIRHLDSTPTQRVIVNGETIDGSWETMVLPRTETDIYVTVLSGSERLYAPNHDETVSISVEIQEIAPGAYEDCPGDPSYSFVSITGPGGVSGNTCAKAWHDHGNNTLNIHMLRDVQDLACAGPDGLPPPNKPPTPGKFMWADDQWGYAFSLMAPLPGQRPPEWSYEGPNVVDPEGPRGPGWARRLPEPGMVLKARASYGVTKIKCLPRYRVRNGYGPNPFTYWLPQKEWSSTTNGVFVVQRPRNEDEPHYPWLPKDQETSNFHDHRPGPAPVEGTVTIERMSSGMIEGTFNFPAHEVASYNGVVFGRHDQDPHIRDKRETLERSTVTGRFRASYKPSLYDAGAYADAGKFNRSIDENGKAVCKKGHVEKGAIGTVKMEFLTSGFSPSSYNVLIRSLLEQGREAFELARELVRAVRRECGKGDWFSTEWKTRYKAFEAVYAPGKDALAVFDK